MRSKFFLIFSMASLAISMVACGGTPTANNGNANTASGNTATNAVATNKSAPEATTNNAPTLTPVFKAYCDAWVKSDEAALRKVYSSDTIKYFEGQMKTEKVKSLIKFLEDDKVSGTPCEATNEEINGDNATANIKSNKYPNGIKIVFVKENGEWKMTNKSPAIDAVKLSVESPNTAKTPPANTTSDKKDPKK